MNHHPLLPAIETFLLRTGMAATTFGQKAAGQWKLVERLRDGGSIGWRQEQSIKDFMQSPAAERIKPRPAARRRAERSAHA